MTHDYRLDSILLVALLVGAAISLGRLVKARPSREQRQDNYFTGREADVAHLLMNLGMAAMLAPWYGTGVRVVLVALFTAMVVTFAGLLALTFVRPAVHAQVQRSSLVYHMLAFAAMIYATTLHHHLQAGAANTRSSMDHMQDMGADHMNVGAAASAPAWILAVVFALDAAATAIFLLFPDAAIKLATGPQAGTGPESRPVGSNVPGQLQAAAAAIPAELTEQPAKSSAGSGRLAAEQSLTTSDIPGDLVRRRRRMTVRVATIPHLVMDVGMVLMFVPIS